MCFVQLLNVLPALLYLFMDIIHLSLENSSLVINLSFIRLLLQLLVQKVNAYISLTVVDWRRSLVITSGVN